MSEARERLEDFVGERVLTEVCREIALYCDVWPSVDQCRVWVGVIFSELQKDGWKFSREISGFQNSKTRTATRRIRNKPADVQQGKEEGSEILGRLGW